ncbi:formate dehydrogenase subunit gamma [Helicobacter marmotae]|uniref:Formate dehydrogenase subunit gamma n=1 Tax=Helicobacter marmotae TaxID=152490 RepID=A0A3D8I6V4_9HELI|nr:formate dehydrogenase subunit gamma [Helicobacter marmotae]RDU60474.1 formate dehydrogenase subunit gamma [Helicobacter marmotae]
MKKLFLFLFLSLASLYGIEEPKGAIEFKTNSNIYGTAQIEAIKNWGMGTKSAGVIEGSVLMGKGGSINPLTYGEEISGIRGWNGLGELFTILQEKYFALIFLLIIIFVPMAFYGHYKIVGQRHYAHNSFLLVFSKYNIIVHWCAAVPFVILCLTGLMMVFGDKLGGGWLVRFVRDVHGFATIFFAIFGVLMFCMWVKDCLFKAYDIKWMIILGGYLDKINREIPAHKFNAGQKMWFWVATLGGGVMVFTGGVMYFQNTDINTLRLMAIVHNVMGFAVIALLITHIYMAVFAIEGALESILNGKMGEEELSMLHSLYYKDLKAQGKLDSMRLKHH